MAKMELREQQRDSEKTKEEGTYKLKRERDAIRVKVEQQVVWSKGELSELGSIKENLDEWALLFGL